MRANTNRHNDGRQFQSLLETIHSAYESRGIARIRKTDPPVRVMGNPAKARVVFQPNPWLDYAGTWGVNNGRAIIIEAKATTEPTLRIVGEGMTGAGIKHTQLVNAESWRDAGAAVAFLWHYNAEIRIFTPAMVRAALTERKSLRWVDVHKIPQGEGFIVFDYLRALFALTKCITGDTLNHEATKLLEAQNGLPANGGHRNRQEDTGGSRGKSLSGETAQTSTAMRDVPPRGASLRQENGSEATSRRTHHTAPPEASDASNGRPLVAPRTAEAP